MSDEDYPERSSVEGSVGEIFKLVSRRATPEEWAEWLRVPLEGAIDDGNIDVVNALIGAGADVSAGSRGCHDRLLLESAASGGNVEVVSALLAAGSPPDLPRDEGSSFSGRSALHMAIWTGHEEAARRLVAGGANVHSRDTFYNPDNRDVLFKAVECRFEELVKDLLVAGASPNPPNGELTPLHVAARLGENGIVSALLASGADKDSFESCGRSPLMEAAANYTTRPEDAFEPGTGRLISVRTDHLAVVQTLLAAGADVELRDGDDDLSPSALSIAAGHGHMDVLNAILAHGADVNAADENSDCCTALHHAALNGEAGAVVALIEAGANIELKNSDALTALGCATTYCYREAMLALLRHGASTDAQGHHGDSLLHLACREQYVDHLHDAVDFLLRSGADETAVNDDGKTPRDLLESPPPFGCFNCSPEEAERVGLLLARAPADRTWRRRCWLVMLFSRASKARIASCDRIGGAEHGTGAAGGSQDCGRSQQDGRRFRQDGECSQLAKAEHVSGGVRGLLEGQAVDNGIVIGAGGEGDDLRAVVGSLIEPGLDDVFHTVVGFL